MSARSSGEYPVWWQQTRLVLHDVQRAPLTVKDEVGAALPFAFDAAKKALLVTLPGSRADFKINAGW